LRCLQNRAKALQKYPRISEYISGALFFGLKYLLIEGLMMIFLNCESK
jgi:hypothetical protein